MYTFLKLSTWSKNRSLSREPQEGDGYVMAIVNNYSLMLSELHVLDANNFSKARTIILLPLRLRPGLYGN